MTKKTLVKKLTPSNQSVPSQLYNDGLPF